MSGRQRSYLPRVHDLGWPKNVERKFFIIIIIIIEE